MTSTSGYSQQGPDDSASDWALRQLQINQILARVRTMVLCQVTKITPGEGSPPPPGTVSVIPLVKIIDGQGNVSSHDSIQNIPVWRVGSGDGQIICDPKVNDIGWLAVSDRDISVVKETQAQSQPGSRRKFDMADGVYMGSILSGAPAQYVWFGEDGITLADKNSNEIVTDATGISINGLKINQSGQVDGDLPVTGALQLGTSIEAIGGGQYAGNILTSGGVEAGVGGADHVTLQGLRVTGVQTGGGVSGPPQPGH
jgi:hypothetical protein